MQTETNALASLKNITVQAAGTPVLENICLTIRADQHWAVIGNSGSGKTTLAHVLTGRIFYDGELDWHFPPGKDAVVEMVEQQHHFKNLSNTSHFYYQQRFNAADAEDSMTVSDVLNTAAGNEWIRLLHLDQLLQKPLLQLSNGENKRLQLAKVLRDNPAVLILDNPFTGLDAEGRKTLHTVLNNICQQGIHLVLITSPAELPVCITHVAVLEKGQLVSAQKKEDYLQQPHHITAPVLNMPLLQQLHQPAENDFELAVKMEAVTIQYGDKIVLDAVDWTVRKGTCWNVAGPNGAGKSTLLSLITADNPQAYANKIILFDRQRGTGESIWDIKRRIGFVSPELHLYFDQHASCFEVIASGLFDTIGLFRQLTNAQEENVLLWMQLMELIPFRHKRIFQLSTSQQRMALLARALVKNPPLLILDEPTQGLDEVQAAFFKQLVTAICETFKTTLIYVSHYSRDLPSCIDHFLLLNNGRVQ